MKFGNLGFVNLGFVNLGFVNLGFVNYFKSIYWTFVEIIISISVIPIIDALYPVMDVHTKYAIICKSINPSSMSDENIACLKLTIKMWDSYVSYVQDLNGGDYFDILIRQRLAKINRHIKMHITNNALKSDSRINYVIYREFYQILGDCLDLKSIDLKYRYTFNNRYFESIFKDDGPYRRFRWCDKL
jgi:hypothetical protein